MSAIETTLHPIYNLFKFIEPIHLTNQVSDTIVIFGLNVWMTLQCKIKTMNTGHLKTKCHFMTLHFLKGKYLISKKQFIE